MSRRPISNEQFEALFSSLGVADRQALLDPDVDHAREALGDAIRAETRSTLITEAPVLARGGRSRLGLRVAAVSAAACVLAAAGLFVSALLPGQASRSVPIGPVGPAPASAATILERAARTAFRQPGATLGRGQLEYVKVIQGLTSGGWARDATGQLVGIRFWQTDTLQTWGSLAGIRRRRTADIHNRFFSATDRAIAQNHHMTMAQLDDEAPGPNHYDEILPAKGPGGPGAPSDSAYSWPALPTKPAALLAALKRQLRSEHVPATSVNLFDAISNGSLFNATSPALRSALYKVLAHLPGVRVLGQRRDPLGRRGIVVAIHGSRTPEYVVLFDAKTANELETEVVHRSPSRNAHIPTFAAGTPLTYTVFVSRGIVNSITQLPSGGHVSTRGASKVIYETRTH